jgi:Lipocalin-like domain
MDFGPAPRGYLIYERSGRMSVHIARSEASDGDFSYFGTYTVDENSGTVTHHIEGASDPQYAGTDQLRFVTWQANRLVLSTPPADVTYVATWEPSDYG